MIGRGAALSGAAAVVAALAVFGMRSPDPGVANGPQLAIARAELADLAAEADEALARLEGALAASLDAARRGSALTVAGDDSPGPQLEAAAVLVAPAAARAADARQRLLELRGRWLILRPTQRPPSIGALPDEVGSITGQLEAAAPVADEFAAMRQRSRRVVELLEVALRAVHVGATDEALAATEEASALLTEIATWRVELQTLPIWLETAGEVTAALDAAVRAVAASDRAALDAALDRYAAAAEEAREADVALAIAMSEGGGALSAAPLRRLTDALRTVREARDALAPLVHGVGSPAH